MIGAKGSVLRRRLSREKWRRGRDDVALAHEPKLRAAVVNYGRLTPADVPELEKAMKGLGKDVDIKIYEGKGHAFMNPNNKKGYDEGAAKDAWARIDTFFAKNLESP